MERSFFTELHPESCLFAVTVLLFRPGCFGGSNHPRILLKTFSTGRLLRCAVDITPNIRSTLFQEKSQIERASLKATSYNIAPKLIETLYLYRDMNLSQFKILTFDVYGTLIDWESGMINALKPLTDRLEADLSRDDILNAHAHYESTAQRFSPSKKYSELLATVYRRLSEHWGISVEWEECLAYGQSVPLWPAFGDSAEALAYLKQHFQLAVLTNTDNVSFSGSNARLGVSFDAVMTAEDVGSYKPDDRNFDYMLETLAHRGIAKEEILHVAESMFHDHQPANRHGLASCWIYRRHDQKGFGATMDPGEMPKANFTFNSMAELAKAHRQELD